MIIWISFWLSKFYRMESQVMTKKLNYERLVRANEKNGAESNKEICDSVVRIIPGFEFWCYSDILSIPISGNPRFFSLKTSVLNALNDGKVVAVTGSRNSVLLVLANAQLLAGECDEDEFDIEKNIDVTADWEQVKPKINQFFKELGSRNALITTIKGPNIVCFGYHPNAPLLKSTIINNSDDTEVNRRLTQIENMMYKMDRKLVRPVPVKRKKRKNLISVSDDSEREALSDYVNALKEYGVLEGWFSLTKIIGEKESTRFRSELIPELERFSKNVSYAVKKLIEKESKSPLNRLESEEFEYLINTIFESTQSIDYEKKELPKININNEVLGRLQDENWLLKMLLPYGVSRDENKNIRISLSDFVKDVKYSIKATQDLVLIKDEVDKF